ncbi:hypothetical protein [Silvimonas sp.]|uniref:DUF7338 family protein n=1 Tax=Silvimonas sp. TaxID=2650811 RepID=UPI002849D22C|nr:hypothetical protein [Silvimonas sp.]MDR3427910.1 hypothetical protein [Silvimonas sp.]
MIWIRNLIVTVIVVLFAPFIALFARPDATLPVWLAWASTNDSNLDGIGTGGDKQFAALRADTIPYWRHVLWLWRNPGQAYSDSVGFVPMPGATQTLRGTLPFGGGEAVAGWFYATVINPDGSCGWQFYKVIHLTSKHCLRIDWGWKLWSWKPGESCQVVNSVSPWMSYSAPAKEVA